MAKRENDLVTRMNEIPDAAIKATMTALAESIDTRMTFEHHQRPGNESIQAKLKGARAKLVTQGVARVIAATEAGVGFINREVNEGKRFNVYALPKIADLAEGLRTGTYRNAVNLAVLKSLANFTREGLSFTGTAVLAAVSDKVRAERGVTKHLVRHTVSQSTAPTQASSTMNALQVLGIVENTGTQKHPVWQFAATPAAEHVRAQFSAAATIIT